MKICCCNNDNLRSINNHQLIALRMRFFKLTFIAILISCHYKPVYGAGSRGKSQPSGTNSDQSSGRAQCTTPGANATSSSVTSGAATPGTQSTTPSSQTSSPAAQSGRTSATGQPPAGQTGTETTTTAPGTQGTTPGSGTTTPVATTGTAVALDIKKSSGTTEFDYSKDGEYRTFTPKSGNAFNKIVKNNKDIWTAQNDNALKVVLMGSGSQAKDLIILLKSNKLVLLHKEGGKNKPWNDVTSNKHDITKLKFYGDNDAELNPNEYDITILEHYYSITFKDNVSCKRIIFGDKEIWKSDDPNTLKDIKAFTLDIKSNDFYVLKSEKEHKKLEFKPSKTPSTGSTTGATPATAGQTGTGTSQPASPTTTASTPTTTASTPATTTPATTTTTPASTGQAGSTPGSTTTTPSAPPTTGATSTPTSGTTTTPASGPRTATAGSPQATGSTTSSRAGSGTATSTTPASGTTTRGQTRSGPSS